MPRSSSVYVRMLILELRAHHDEVSRDIVAPGELSFVTGCSNIILERNSDATPRLRYQRWNDSCELAYRMA